MKFTFCDALQSVMNEILNKVGKWVVSKYSTQLGIT